MSDVYSSKWRRLDFCVFFFSAFPWSLLSYPQPIWTLKFWKQKEQVASCAGRFWMRHGVCTQQFPLCPGVLPGKVSPLYLASRHTCSQDVATCLCSPSLPQGIHNLDIHASAKFIEAIAWCLKAFSGIS